MSFPETLQRRASALDGIQQRRRLAPRGGIDFSSNDYLGFAADTRLGEAFHAALRGNACGAAGSRLLRGNLDLHEEAERALARFSGREAALLFPSGYQANLALLSSVAGENDFIYSDSLNHASLIDGARLSRAGRRIYPHNDLAALRAMLERDAAATGLKLIVTESVFSMDGDAAPLAALADLAAEHDAYLVVDESHATGLYGPAGAGLVSTLPDRSRVLATVHTGGKALGAAGAWVAGDSLLREHLVNFSRPFIFSTAVLPALAILLRLSVEHWARVGAARAETTLSRSRLARERLGVAVGNGAGRLPAGDSPIVPIIIGANADALRIAHALQGQGFDVRAIRPPTVPEGTARLRITITHPVVELDIQRLADALSAALREGSRA